MNKEQLFLEIDEILSEWNGGDLNIGKEREELIKDKLEEAINYTESREELICVDNVNYEFLTIGKKYNLSCETDNYYRIENDLGHVVDMSKVRFGKVTAN